MPQDMLFEDALEAPPQNNKSFTLLLDCNNHLTGGFDGHIVNIEVYDGDEKIIDLFDERAGLYEDVATVTIEPHQITFREDEAITIPITARLNNSPFVNAPCWEAFTIEATSLASLLNWLIENSNFTWSCGDDEIEAVWENCLNNDSGEITPADLT